jgi:hypothetical protein
MRPHLFGVVFASAVGVIALGGCGTGDTSPVAGKPGVSVHWRTALNITRPVDLAGPRADGRVVVAANGRLALLRVGARPRPFARGPRGYTTQVGPEPYIALSPGQAVPGAGCRFDREAIYALEPQGQPGLIVISRSGQAKRVLDLGGSGLLNGIAFDTTGRFAHRLLVTATKSGHTTVFAIDCRARVRTLTRVAPAVEGGVVVAPSSFGRFGGDLIAPDERSGRMFAISPDGRARLVAQSGIPRGGDVGVESAAFVPRGLGAGWSAYVADRVSPGNAHPGDDVLLSLSGRSLLRAGVHPGDLIVAGEGGAQTVSVRCRRTCSVDHFADGPTAAHPEGHIIFARAG